MNLASYKDDDYGHHKIELSVLLSKKTINWMRLINPDQPITTHHRKKIGVLMMCQQLWIIICLLIQTSSVFNASCGAFLFMECVLVGML